MIHRDDSLAHLENHLRIIAQFQSVDCNVLPRLHSHFVIYYRDLNVHRDWYSAVKH